MTTSATAKAEALTKGTNVPFGGYFKNKLPRPDEELTKVGPGTPMGEYMRRFWHPVCLSQEIGDLPKAIRILGEDLVVFRDKGGRIGLLHRHCSHRGASLEFGIVSERGIRCCYHGWLYDVDGTILETPCEPQDSRLKSNICHGAYPTFERFGVVFAYFGPPEAKPAFDEYDAYSRPTGTRIIPYSNFYPCNWLQVCENIIDHFHTCTLHSNMVADGTDRALAARLSLAGFENMPVVQWEATHDGNGLIFVAGRRMSEERIWVRITTNMLPNISQVGSPTPQASRERHSGVGHTRWTVPIDDENCVVIGLRHFNDEVDPEGVGREEDLGVEKFDFLGGQVKGRPYEEQQRAPGDWEALVSQRPIAIHALENPGRSDAGVYLQRRLLRAAVRGEAAPNKIHRKMMENGETLHSYTQDSILRISRKQGVDDRTVLKDIGRKILGIMKEADDLPSKMRSAHIHRLLNELGDGEALGIPVGTSRGAAA